MSEAGNRRKKTKKSERGKIKDGLVKIVHVRQNKQSLCGKIPAGLPPPPQLVTADPRGDALLGFLKHDNKGREQKRRQESQSAAQINSGGCVT